MVLLQDLFEFSSFYAVNLVLLSTNWGDITTNNDGSYEKNLLSTNCSSINACIADIITN